MIKGRTLIILQLIVLLLVGITSQVKTVPTLTNTTVRCISDVTQLGPGDVIGTEFTFAVVIEDVTELWAFTVKIYINQTYFEYVSHTSTVPVENYPDPIPPSPYPGILHADQAAVTQVKDEYDPNTGILEVSYSTTAPSSPFNGNGTVCIVTLRLKSQPVGTENYVDVACNFIEIKLAGYDLPPPPIPYDKEDLVIRVYGRPSPPAPTLTIGYQYKGMIPHQFNLSISIENLDEYWDLVGFDVKLKFRPDLVKIINVTLGDFSEYYNLTRSLYLEINSTTGDIWAAFIWDPMSGVRTSPSGNGTLLLIELEANCSVSVTVNQVKLASFPHPERQEPPWNGSQVSVPIPYTLVNEGVTIVGIRQHIISEFPDLIVSTESNSDVHFIEFSPDHRLLLFEVEGDPEIPGFCNVSIPLQLMWPVDGFRVFVDGKPVDFQVTTNGTHAFIYFEYSHSVHYLMILNIEAIPEFPNTWILAILMLLLTTVVFRKRSKRD